MTSRFIYVNIDLRHQCGISVAESQTFLLAKRPSAAMSEEKQLSFAGYSSSSSSLSLSEVMLVSSPLTNSVLITLISFIMKFYLLFRVNFLYSKVVFH